MGASPVGRRSAGGQIERSDEHSMNDEGDDPHHLRSEADEAEGLERYGRYGLETTQRDLLTRLLAEEKTSYTKKNPLQH